MKGGCVHFVTVGSQRNSDSCDIKNATGLDQLEKPEKELRFVNLKDSSNEITMGMFDDIKCKYQLPISGANDLDYQTKDTEHQWLDQYEIREDGTLWHEDYDIEDHSERAKWIASNPDNEVPKELDGMMSMMGCMARVNKRWEQVNITGEIRFYTLYDVKEGKMVNAHNSQHGWIEWSAYFVNGKLKEMNLLENRKP